MKNEASLPLSPLLLIAALALVCSHVELVAGEPVGRKPATSDKGFRVEHFALAGPSEYLDGPRTEAMLPYHRVGQCDADGNLYLVPLMGYGALRCARVDGRMQTIAGDNVWGTDLELDEGPAACLPNLLGDSSFGSAGPPLCVRGSPLQGGEKGSIYVVAADTRASGRGIVYRIWKNGDQRGRWWFSRVAGGGSKPAPSTRGAKVAGRDVWLNRPRFTMDAGGSDKVFIVSEGNAWLLDDRSGTMTCVLAHRDYRDRVKHWRQGAKLSPPDEVVIADDGTAYLNWYKGSYPNGMIYRVSADRRQVELVVFNAQDQNKEDGPGLQTYWFGGPQMNGYQPPDLIFAGAVDDRRIRRLKDGRIASLCRDGKWREIPTRRDVRQWQLYAGFGTSGWALMRNKPYFYRVYGSKSDGKIPIVRIGPVDWQAPAVAVRKEGKQ
ncbi:MAG: hypothetical protein KatS3mg105_3188 [Gemmatales bacterium]|nr:MAG: hypothetical protein KatS3mg105_3188 [Gemmatales bacterium]